MSLSPMVKLQAIFVVKCKRDVSNLNEEYTGHRGDDMDLHLNYDASYWGDNTNFPPNSSHPQI